MHRRPHENALWSGLYKLMRGNIQNLKQPSLPPSSTLFSSPLYFSKFQTILFFSGFTDIIAISLFLLSAVQICFGIFLQIIFIRFAFWKPIFWKWICTEQLDASKKDFYSTQVSPSCVEGMGNILGGYKLKFRPVRFFFSVDKMLTFRNSLYIRVQSRW